MCGRYVLSTWTDVIELLGLDPEDGAWFEPRYNIAPTQRAPVLLQRDAAAPLLAEQLRWGLIPPWAKERAFGARCINARGESAHEKPSFRDAFVRRRCVVPASGFYEWRREGKARLPYFVHRSDGLPLLFGGLWSTWTDPNSGESLESFAIVTRASSGALAELHDRGPLCLEPDLARAWARPGALDRGGARAVVAEAPTPDLKLRPVATTVNNVRNQGPELVVASADH